MLLDRALLLQLLVGEEVQGAFPWSQHDRTVRHGRGDEALQGLRRDGVDAAVQIPERVVGALQQRVQVADEHGEPLGVDGGDHVREDVVARVAARIDERPVALLLRPEALRGTEEREMLARADPLRQVVGHRHPALQQAGLLEPVGQLGPRG